MVNVVNKNDVHNHTIIKLYVHIFQIYCIPNSEK